MIDIKTLIAVATGKIPHNYRSGLCPDELQPDSRDPDCPACKILIEAAAELEAEGAERPVAWMNEQNGFICKDPKNADFCVPLYAAPPVTAQSEGKIDKPTSLLRRAADYLGDAGAPRLASEISSYLESQAQPARGEG